MKNIKKLKSYGKAVAGSALLVGATLTGAAGLAAAQSGSSGQATLADYPHPFVDDQGNLDSTVVVGTEGKQSDVVSAIDIAGNLGSNAFSSETVEGVPGAVDGEQTETTIRDTDFGASIDASDYTGFVRKTVEDDDGNDVFVTESADMTNVDSSVNETDIEVTFGKGDIVYDVKYSPGFSVDDTITLLGEEYELTEIVSDSEVDLGSTVSNDVQVGDSFTHGPFTVEVTGRTRGDNPEPVIRISRGEETLDRKALSETDSLTVGSDDEFTVKADTVIFYDDGTEDITLESTYTDTTLEEGEDLPMDDRYQVQNLGVNSAEDRLSSIKIDNTVRTVDEPEDDDEVAPVTKDNSFTGPNNYFSVTNQGLSNEATGQISFGQDYEVTYQDANNFEHSLDLRDVVTGGSAQLFAFADGTTTSPTMFVDESSDGAGSDSDAGPADTTGYDDGDDILKFTRLVDKGTDLNSKTLSDFSSSEYYVSPAGNTFDGSQAIVDSANSVLESNAEIDKSGTAGVLTSMPSSLSHYEDGSGTNTNGGQDYDASGSSYGEAIYDESGGTSPNQVDAGDTRVTGVTVNSGTSDTDVTTVDLGLSNFAAVASTDNDAGKSLTAASANIIKFDHGTGDTEPAWESASDDLYLDVDGTGTVTEGDIVLIDNDTTNSFTNGHQITSSEATTLQSETPTNNKATLATSTSFDINIDDASGGGAGYQSNDNIYLDVGGDAGTEDNAATTGTPDIQLTGGPTVVTSTPTTYSDQTASIDSWDADGSTGQTVQDSVYVDVGPTGSVATDDVRLAGFTASYTASSNVVSSDVDTGATIDSFGTSEYFLNDNNANGYENGEAIIVNTGTTGANLESTDTIKVSGDFTTTGSAQTFPDGASGNAQMFVGTTYDGSQEILGITRETNGGSDVALDGTTLNNFGALVKHTDGSGTYSDSATIVQDSDDDGVYNSGIDTVLKGSEPSGTGEIISADDSDKTVYTDISGYPLEIEWDSSSQEATLSYKEFEKTVAVGDTQETFSTGYGFSFDARFDTNPDNSGSNDLVISGTDRVLNTEEGAKIWKSGDNTVVEEENSETITVEYSDDGSSWILNQVSFSGAPSTLTDTDDGESTLTNWGSAVELDSDSSATVTYPDEQRNQLTAFGAVGEGSSAGEVMSPTGWPSNSAALDTEASTDQNLVLVGGPLVNDLTADLASQGNTWNSTQYESNQGVGVLDLVNNAFNGNNALVVAGWQADDTSAAAQYLVENAGAEELEGKTTVQVNTESGELVQ